MDEPRLIFRVHALQRMFERGITEVEVRVILESGEVIEEDAMEEPYPTRLFLGRVEKRSLHVLVAIDGPGNTMIVVTVYEPDPALWEPGFKRRKRP